MSSDEVDGVNEIVVTAINSYNQGKLEEQILNLILSEIEGNKLRKIWDILPEKFREMEEYQKKLPCLEHNNRSWMEMEEQYNGPPPPKYLCSGCNQSKNYCNPA